MLKVDNANVYYGQVHALKNLTLEVEEGELVALLGANGAGKSTSLMAISGIIRPKNGSIKYDGKEITRSSADEIVGLGLVQCPEGRRIFGSLTVMENLRMGAIRRKDKNNLPAELERVFSLFPVLGKRVKQSGATLSGGEQQMLAIGRAMMAKPRLLMLDEPSLGLAPMVVQEIFNVIKQLHAEGVTILLVEQNARQALEICNRGYLLQTGQVALSGTGKELRVNPEVERLYLGGSGA